MTEQQTWRIQSTNPDDAIREAKLDAAEQGWKVRTFCSIRKVVGLPGSWDVKLAVYRPEVETV